MCGIVGKLFFDQRRKVSVAEVEHMASAILHRGPDGHGVHISGAVGLGHRRLSIIDIDGGAQPLSNENDTVWVVFNGEIYNYRALRNRLIQLGHTFKTNSDTEVIVHCYEEYGADCVKHFRGMFAFAVWDEKEQTLFLARDRVGIKPLYYYLDGNFLLFGSEVKALLTDIEVPRGVNTRAIGRFLTHTYTAGDETPFEGIKKLPPGCTLTAQGGAVKLSCYWDLQFPEQRRNLSLEEAAEQLTERLRESMRLHMISDVPVGFLLSGGVDSTGLLSLAVNETDKRISTFTVGFAGQGFSDERPYARLAAERFGTLHYDMTVTSQEFADFLPKYVWYMEEPVCEPPAINLFYVSKLASGHVKVLISGEGADEEFGGYPEYTNLPAFERVRGVMEPFRSILRHTCDALKLPRAGRYARLLNYSFEKYYLSRSTTPMTWFNSGSHRDLTDVVGPMHESTRGLDLLSRMLYVDTKTWLPDDLLIKADRMTMANSVELRVPFLDHEILEFAASLPSQLKVSGRQTKRVLKRVFHPLIPREIIQRKKTGFPVPYSDWFRKGLRPFVADILLDSKTAHRGYFSKNEMENLLASHDTGVNCSKDIFGLIVLELWHRTFIDR